MSERYNERYSLNENLYGGDKPQEIVISGAELLPSGSKVIDFGAGQGRNAIPLAEMGFDVTAVDTSQVGIDQINQRNIPNLKAEVMDARAEIVGQYDMVVSIALLHFLDRKDGLDFIKKIKNHTNEGGLNVVRAFTNKGDNYKLDLRNSHRDKDNFYLNLGELKEIYSDWEILLYDEVDVESSRKYVDGTPLRNVIAQILARKPKK